MKLIKLTHANKKVPVWINPQQVAGIYLGVDNSTHIISVGAIVPVSETPAEVVSLVEAAFAGQPKQPQDGAKE